MFEPVPRTLNILLPLAVVLLAPIPLGFLLRRALPRRRGYLLLALALAAVLSVVLTTLMWQVLDDLRPHVLHSDPVRPDSYVVFGFGLGQPAVGQPTAGESNLALARWLVSENRDRLPTIVQEGVYLALRELEVPQLDDWVTCLPSPPGVYIDTAGGALQTEVILAQKKLTRPVLAAHDLQLERMVWTFQELGRADFVVAKMPAIPFDPNSSQHSGTKFRAAWVVRELFAARPVTLRPRATIALLVGITLLYVAVVWREVRRGKVVFRNPVPVAAVMLPVDGGLLLVRRAIEPAKGQLTFPGGYVNEGESWQAAAARELLEETGISLDPAELELFDAISTRRGHLIVLYAIARPRSRADLPPFTPTPEATELVVIDRPMSFTWEQDTRVTERFFAGRGEPGA
jgi:ADP-ribose pyrophosphatase YjhB (NUDIX family)